MRLNPPGPYISLTEIAKNFAGAKDAMTVRVDGGDYRKAFVVLDTKQFDTLGEFQKALTECLDAIRRRLTMGDCADDVVCRDFITRNPHNAYAAPLPTSLPERVVAGSDLSDEGQTAGCDVREGGGGGVGRGGGGGHAVSRRRKNLSLMRNP